jgi:Uma2 family endonuclease
MVTHARLTVEEFDRIAALPENVDKRLEFVAGEIVELVSNNYCSEVAFSFGTEINVHVKRNGLGRVTGADGGYRVFGERYIPDVAFISKARQPEPSHEAYNPQAPDLVVEVVSPTDVPKDVLEKVANYIAAGTVVWLVYPDIPEVKVFEPGLPVKTVTVDGILDGGSVLPGFKLPLSTIFSQS